MTATQHRTYTIQQIRQANKDADEHWFSPSTMRFFDSRIGRTTYGPDSDGFVYFVSSERFDWRSPRLYTIRRFDPREGTVDTVGEFQGYVNGTMAANAARKLARQ